MVSVAFAFLTLLIYAAVIKDLNTHGCAQLSFFTALFLFYTVEGSRVIFKRNGFSYKASVACFVHGK